MKGSIWVHLMENSPVIDWNVGNTCDSTELAQGDAPALYDAPTGAAIMQAEAELKCCTDVAVTQLSSPLFQPSSRSRAVVVGKQGSVGQRFSVVS